MKTYHNENGLTLLEVLLSIVILSIILVSVVNFFPQMGLMNKQNIDKQQAINTAKDTLFDFQNEPYLRELIVNPASSDEFEFIERIDDFNFFKFKGKKNGFDVTVKLKVKPDIGSGGGRELYQIHIQLLNHKGTLITETYGYIVLD